jgi:hypothetical protein
MDEKLFCPRCGGKEILYEWGNPGFVGYGAPLPRKCATCGFRSMIFPAEPEDEKPAKKTEKDITVTPYIVVIIVSLIALYMLFR